ncbi:Holliday junction resolvase RuvX [Candidatus Saccharibacteria bacterium]|nr:Holliday junction resolvase RuvX [Candidatus Saccharibacteria bacterium]
MRILALDVGTKRIGVAFADTAVRIAIPRGMIPVDGSEFAEIAKQFRLEKADIIVSGSPRNNSGEETRQTESVRQFIDGLKQYFVEQGNAEPKVFFQDESYTSITAEELLKPTRADRKAGKVDEEAAAVILQDFLERPDLKEIEEKL